MSRVIPRVDITEELEDWAGAVYGEEVRSANVSALIKLQQQTNDACDMFEEIAEDFDERDEQWAQDLQNVDESVEAAAGSASAAAASETAAAGSASAASASETAAAASQAAAASSEEASEAAAERAEEAAGSVENPVSYAPQTLTPAEQQQAAENIGLGDVKASLTQLNGLITGHTNLFNDIISKEAAAHNAIYRGKNLTSVYTIEQLSAKVRSGDFSDLYIGDYITKQVTIAGTQYNVDWVIADFNYFKRMGDTECTQNHIVLMPRNNIYSAKMNDSNSTAGGYKGSKMWTTEMVNVATGIKNAFGASHVLKHRELLSNAMNASTASMAGAGFTGASSGWEWTDVEANICNEPMVYGGKVFSSSFYDIGDRKSQLNIFRHNHSFATNRSDWWLSAVASGTYFAYVTNNGNASYGSASYSFGVRPYFLFY